MSMSMPMPISVPVPVPVSMPAPTPAPPPVLEKRQLKPSYVRAFVPELEPEEQPAPRMLRKQGGGFSNYKSTPRNDRRRSETNSSSSSEEPYEEEPIITNRVSQLLHHYNTTTKHNDSQNYATVPSGHYSSPMINHRYSVPNNRYFQGEPQETVSSRVSARRPDKTMSAADSAKQLLASIRERRKSALIIGESPKMEGRTRFISSSSTSQQETPDLRSRIHVHRESLSNRSVGNKYHSPTSTRRYNTEDMQACALETGNDGRLTSRLPQRTLYR
ncbi:uncharacterized protein EV154DRAFT_479342 [Mucor mucedo]|uniref:uncharacterized protein n=1 Tax=Mucor mucedo TaxID=29922 RepID=UPI00221FA736|nr:uncharacterized protein EV154DRAFT_479342 [Mucor mucedo]KAI7893332.1 hypothetical protein EV154DRAFT_479342 [Mucor mucedo]